MTQAQRLPGTGLRNAARMFDIDLLFDRIAQPLRGVVERPARIRWERGESPNPPQTVKWKVIDEYAVRYRLKHFVETGTYLGHTLYAMRERFDVLHSIELSQALYDNAQRRFRRTPNVRLWLGDSAKVLPEVLAQLERPALFWLDGHYSEGITARGDKDTPILEELSAIFTHPVRGHVVLIDDARCFTGQNDYPTLDALRAFCERQAPGTSFEAASDIVRLTPPARGAGGAASSMRS